GRTMRPERRTIGKSHRGLVATLLTAAACAAPGALPEPESPAPAAAAPAAAARAAAGPAAVQVERVYVDEIAALAADPRVQQAFRVIDGLHDRTRADHIALTQIPAPPFNEQARAERYAELLREAGADSVWIDSEGNVLALRLGT